MKKITLIAAALLLATGAMAQNQPQFGIKGGLNMASEMADDGQTESRVGIHLGFFMEAKIARMIDFQPEILYSMQGGGGDELDYINVPLMFKFYTGQARRFSIDAGPQLGYMIRANYLYDYVNKFDAALGVGVSYKFNGGLDIGFRVAVSGTPILDGYSQTNAVSQLGVGYRF
ncbi:MAG: PorT family protein [Alistipes sp.]|jgi:hypothetical protein|nr:PorT family protein [Alistipes sp.]